MQIMGFAALIVGVKHEAARIDGVSSWTVLWEITLPLLKPTIVFIVVFSSIGFLRIFDHVYNMTTQNPGGPLNSTTSAPASRMASRAAGSVRAERAMTTVSA